VDQHTDQLLVEASDLVKVYNRKRVVNGVHLTVKPGEIVGLLGPNGAGKTTSFYMIIGLVNPSEGRVFFRGRDVSRTPMFKRARMGMGYLAQEPSIFRRLTVEENVMAILETLPLSARERRERLAFLLDELKISHLARQRAYTLSGGGWRSPAPWSPVRR
jgi:lipopolysaccharide export system ATP-binding protein